MNYFIKCFIKFHILIFIESFIYCLAQNTPWKIQMKNNKAESYGSTQREGQLVSQMKGLKLQQKQQTVQHAQHPKFIVNFEDANTVSQRQNQFIFKKRQIKNQRLNHQIQSHNTLININSSNNTIQTQTKIKPTSSSSTEQTQDMKLYEEYQRDICGKKKTIKHKNCGHPVTFQSYKNIRSIWEKNPFQILKPTKRIKSLENLTVDTFCKLRYRKWLNDQVINAYIELIEIQLQTFKATLAKLNKKLQIKIVNTFFATLLNKQKASIQRIIKKSLLNPEQVIIIPINQDNLHWFFLVVQKGHLQIFDSLSQKNKIETYKKNSVVLNVIKFMTWFFNQDKIIKTLSNFPQQNNSYDCGVMMLSGIHNFVQHTIEKVKVQIKLQNSRNKQLQKPSLQFNFSQDDAVQKRFQFATQLYDEKITTLKW